MIKDVDRGWVAILREARGGSASVDAGILGDEAAREHPGYRRNGSGLTVGDVATKNEYGDGRTPPRSFIREPFDAGRSVYTRELQKTLARSSALDALEGIARHYLADIKATIRSRISPPLAQRTLDERRAAGIAGDIPLLATRTLINSLSTRRGR